MLIESLAIDTCSDDDSVALKTKVLVSKMHKQLRLATWNFLVCASRKRLLTC